MAGLFQSRPLAQKSADTIVSNLMARQQGIGKIVPSPQNPAVPRGSTFYDPPESPHHKMEVCGQRTPPEREDTRHQSNVVGDPKRLRSLINELSRVQEPTEQHGLSANESDLPIQDFARQPKPREDARDRDHGERTLAKALSATESGRGADLVAPAKQGGKPDQVESLLCRTKSKRVTKSMMDNPNPHDLPNSRSKLKSMMDGEQEQPQEKPDQDQEQQEE